MPQYRAMPKSNLECRVPVWSLPLKKAIAELDNVWKRILKINEQRAGALCHEARLKRLELFGLEKRMARDERGL